MVGGFMVEADKHLILLERHLAGLVRKWIPEEDWRTFFFHTMELWNGSRYFHDKDKWPPEKRFEILDDLCAVPEKFDLLLSCGFVSRSDAANFAYRPELNVTAEEKEGVILALALAKFSETIEDFVRVHLPDEVALLILEDRSTLKAAVREMHEILRDGERLQANGIVLNSFPFERVRETIHFADKRVSPPLWMADLCTFFVKGFLMRKPFVDRFWSVLKPSMIAVPKEETRTPLP